MEPLTAARSRRGSAGFSLVEALVALVLVALALALASGLLREAVRLYAVTAREQRDPLISLVADQLRTDVQSSGAVVPDPGDGSLGLAGHPAGTVVYRQDGPDLMRAVFDPTGRLLGERPVLRSLVSWSWRQVGPAVVEVDVVYRRFEEPSVHAAGTRLPAPARARPAAISLTLALRARPRINRW